MRGAHSVRAYARAVTAIILFIVWSLSGFTGFLLWIAPEGPRSGRALLLLDMTKSEWGDVHLWMSLAALVVTVIHIAIDWCALRGCMRYLASAHRGPEICT